VLACGLVSMHTFGPWGCVVLWLHRGCVDAARTPRSLFHTLRVLVLTVMWHHYLFAVLDFAAGIALKCAVCDCAVQRDCCGAFQFGVVRAGGAVHGVIPFCLWCCGGLCVQLFTKFAAPTESAAAAESASLNESATCPENTVFAEVTGIAKVVDPAVISSGALLAPVYYGQCSEFFMGVCVHDVLYLGLILW
jgi:hypothetical protein